MLPRLFIDSIAVAILFCSFSFQANAQYQVTRIREVSGTYHPGNSVRVLTAQGDTVVKNTFTGDDEIIWDGIEAIYAKKDSKPYVFTRQSFQKKGATTASSYLRHKKASSRRTLDLEPGRQDKYLFPSSRIALVIGNTHYEWESNLINSYHDVRDVSAKLKSLGFDVVTCYDAGYAEFREDIESFYKLSAKYDVALFYYAGHGIQDKETVYLVPCDVNTQYETCKPQLISVNELATLASATSKNDDIFFWDACRDIKVGWMRSVGNVAKNPIEAPRGVSYMFSTGSGTTASDGGEENSPFAKAFLDYVGIPNNDLGKTLTEIRFNVAQSTEWEQDPVFQCRESKPFFFLAEEDPETTVRPVIIELPGHIVNEADSNGKGNTSGKISFFISEKEEPVITVVPESIAFEDENKNQAIDAGERCAIRFTVKNIGSVDCKDALVRVFAGGSNAGIRYDNVELKEIPVGASSPVVIPINAGNDIRDGRAFFNFQVFVSEGFTSDSYKVQVSTLRKR